MCPICLKKWPLEIGRSIYLKQQGEHRYDDNTPAQPGQSAKEACCYGCHEEQRSKSNQAHSVVEAISLTLWCMPFNRLTMTISAFLTCFAVIA